MNLETFLNFMKTMDGTLKPVMIFFVDGEPHEIPAFASNISIDRLSEFNSFFITETQKLLLML